MPFQNLNYKVYRVLTLLYGLLILGLSSIPSTSFPDLSIWTMDKLIHFAEYSILGFLFLMGFPVKKGNFIAILFLSGIAFGAFDEYYQSYIPGREMDFKDWLADSIGFISGAAGAVYIRYRNDNPRID